MYCDQMRFFLVELPVGGGPGGLDAALATIDEHFDWIRRQHESGALLISGPAADFSRGLLLMKAESREDLDHLLNGEPSVARGSVTPVVTEWDVHQFMGFGPFETEAVARLWPVPARAALAAKRSGT